MAEKILEKSYSFYKGIEAQHVAMGEKHAMLHKSHMDHHDLHKATAEALDDTHEEKTFHAKKAVLHKADADMHNDLSDMHKAAAQKYSDMAECMKAEEVVDLSKTATSAPTAAAAATPAKADKKVKNMNADEIKKCAAAMGITEEEFVKKYVNAEAPASPAASAAAAAIAAGAGPTADAAAKVISNATALPLEERLKVVTDAFVEKALLSLNNDPKVGEVIEQIVLMRVGEVLGKKIVPDNISGVITKDAPQQAFGIHAVPRTGAPAPVTSAEKAAVAPQFSHLISSLDGGE